MEICSNAFEEKRVGGKKMMMGLGRQTVLTFLLWLILRPSVIYQYKNKIKNDSLKITASERSLS